MGLKWEPQLGIESFKIEEKSEFLKSLQCYHIKVSLDRSNKLHSIFLVMSCCKIQIEKNDFPGLRKRQNVLKNLLSSLLLLWFLGIAFFATSQSSQSDTPKAQHTGKEFQLSTQSHYAVNFIIPFPGRNLKKYSQLKFIFNLLQALYVGLGLKWGPT